MTSLGFDGRHVGARIAEARRSRGLSQKDLARALEIRLLDVERLESGMGDPRRHLSAIGAATGHAADWFTDVPDVAAKARPAPLELERRAAGIGGAYLVLCALTLLIVVRFFSETLHVLPRAANFVDIPVFLTLASAAILTPRAPVTSGRTLRIGGPVFGFLALAALSTAFNTGRVAVAPVLVFVYGFLAPFAVYLAVYRLWPAGSAALLSRLLVALGVLELAIVFLVNLPQFLGSRNPDEITGTFGTNPYQLVFFLIVIVALLVGIAANEPQRLVARFAPLLIVGAFVAIMLAQYRSLLVSMVVAMAAVAVLLGRSPRGVLAALVATAVFAGAFYYVATSLPALKLESAATSVVTSPGTYIGGRFEVARNVFRLYSDIPSAVVVGTGPGTYSSRAWQTFANADSRSLSNVQGGYASALVGGKAYSTDVSEKYVEPQLQQGVIVEGSHAVSTPYSSYASLLAEIGVIGMALIVLVYVLAVARSWSIARGVLRAPVPGDPLPALTLATFVAFLTLLQAALLENWFEVTRVTFVVWMMLAVVTKELGSRQEGV